MSLKTTPIYSSSALPEGHLIQRDGMPFRTPAGINLLVPRAALADAIVEEWKQQVKKIVPSTMPMTQLAMTTLDITAKDREAVRSQLLGYVDSELLCHQVEDPQALAERQNLLWQPILNWCAERFRAVLTTGTGVMPVRQKPETKEALRLAIETYDDWTLTGLSYAVDSCGSLVLGLALVERQLSVQQVVEAAELDAHFQMEKWGEDPAILKRQNQIRDDLETVLRWLEVLSLN